MNSQDIWRVKGTNRPLKIESIVSFVISNPVRVRNLPQASRTLVRDLLLNTKEGLNKLQNSFSRHSGVGQNQVKTIVYSALSGKLVPDVFNRICPIFVLSRSTSCIHAVVDAGIHQHDDKDT